MSNSVSWNERRPEEAPRQWFGAELEPDEKVMHEIRESAFGPVFNWLAVTALLYFWSWWFVVPNIAVAFVVSWWVSERRYAVTSKRFLGRTGAFQKTAIQIRLDRITDVTVKRPPGAQFGAYGEIHINTAGGPNKEVVIPRLTDPDAVASMIRRY